MKGDIVLKIIISFIIPFAIIYSFSYVFNIVNIGFLSILNFIIFLTISYALFFLRFGKIDIRKTFSIEGSLNVLLFILLGFFVFLLIKLMGV